MKKTGWILTLVLSLLLAGCLPIQPGDAPSDGGGSYQTISAKQAYEMMQKEIDFILLDVRTAEEYAQQHIDGALLIPVDQLKDRAAQELPDKDAVILLYCRSGRRSAQAADELASLGYTNVYDFGGIIDWPYETVKE